MLLAGRRLDYAFSGLSGDNAEKPKRGHTTREGRSHKSHFFFSRLDLEMIRGL